MYLTWMQNETGYREAEFGGSADYNIIIGLVSLELVRW